MTYNKTDQDFVNAFIERVREKIEVFEYNREVEVRIHLSYPLRNDNPSVRIEFISKKLLAELVFWSGKTYQVGVYDEERGEIILGHAGYFEEVAEVETYLDQIIQLYLAPNIE